MDTDIASILKQLATSSPEHVHLSRFIGGVVYALEEYDRLAIVAPKETKSDEFYAEEALRLLTAIQGAAGPPTNWLRGFFYNAAITRLDAAWERSLRVILRNTSKEDGPTLYNRLCQSEPTLPRYDDSVFKQVRTEVNALKHEDEGPSEGIREKPDVLRQGLRQLLTLLKRRINSAV